MKYVARIFKVGSDTYIFNGKIYDSFIAARRDMTEACRIRKETNEKDVRTRSISVASSTGGYLG